MGCAGRPSRRSRARTGVWSGPSRCPGAWWRRLMRRPTQRREPAGPDPARPYRTNRHRSLSCCRRACRAYFASTRCATLPPRCSWAPATGSTNLLFFFSTTPRRLVALDVVALALAHVAVVCRRRRLTPSASL